MRAKNPRIRVEEPKPRLEPGKGNGRTEPDDLESHIPFWRNLELISEYQRGILENCLWLWTQGAKTWMQFAPTNLFQNILGGWNFSAIQFTRQIKGNPEIESKILTEVAGYGSQLGTIMDYLEVVSKQEKLSLKDLEGDDAAKFVRFHDLLGKIERVKKLPAS
jgi:DNA-binding ferritin-like protein (Dps family)